MNLNYDGELGIRSEGDIIAARTTVRDLVKSLGFGVTDTTRIVTATAELARNVLLYAGKGTMRWQRLYTGGQIAIQLDFQDKGPGIPDIEKAMEKGYTTGNGLGLGLPGTKRLMDDFEIQSEVGKGTRVVVRKWLRRA